MCSRSSFAAKFGDVTSDFMANAEEVYRRSRRGKRLSVKEILAPLVDTGLTKKNGVSSSDDTVIAHNGTYPPRVRNYSVGGQHA